MPIVESCSTRSGESAAALLCGDRLLDEAQGGDARMICGLFGLSIQAVSRYTATSPDAST